MMPERASLIATLPLFLLLPLAGCGEGGGGAAGGAADDAAVDPADGGSAASGAVAYQGDGFRVVAVTRGLEHPWGMAFLPDGGILVTERAGRLRLVRDGVLDPAPITGVPAVWANGQGGLLDVALHPDFAENGWVYLSFSKPGPGGETATTAVVRGRLDGHALTGVEEIFEADAWTRAGVHFGSRLVFDGEGRLFVTVGDRGQMERAQDPSNHQGTINRLNDDGSIPDDNPFVGRAGHEPSIWAYGIRSPQGLSLQPATGELIETEHGPRGGDELNHIRPGRNYGWPAISFGINYDGTVLTEDTARAGMEQPLHYWVPSIATSGLAFYTGDRFPQWRGSAFVGGLAGTVLARVEMDGLEAVSEERLLADWGERIRDVRDGPDGFLYLLTDVARGGLYRLEPTR
ncbi:MAG: PQQ-dependent sugar dehydrogenase [Longimicrobiales bacterium]|nr:PQQ-dependent sugar dehydrogenase [Longimicrobiales bacterium]